MPTLPVIHLVENPLEFPQLSRRRRNISELRPLKGIDERRLPPRLGPVV
jgi:hypothetical protein